MMDEPSEAMIEAGCRAFHDANRFQVTSQKVRAMVEQHLGLAAIPKETGR